ncbi:aldehyde dehydrogenase family protein [Candidatus Woesearchaeota archaeon]|nr:aldehyde dehydrogenase family protein [Candidatus Woesearchaeota archaeon]
MAKKSKKANKIKSKKTKKSAGGSKAIVLESKFQGSYQLYIDGRWQNAYSKQTFDVINPANSQVIAKAAKADIADTKRAIDAARKAFDSGVWSNKTPAERASILWKLAELVEQNLERLSYLESLNQGKTIKYSHDSDFPFIIDNLKFFAGAARMLEGKAAAEYTGLGTSFVRREPIGVCACIIPWNYPLYIAVWQIAPALAAGNCVVAKPATLTPITLLEFCRLAEQAGVPAGVLNVITGSGDVLGPELATNPKVDMVSVTGDNSTGKKVMQLAASTLKRVHLELGGKAPMIVLEDCDLEIAAEGAIAGAYWNAGQDCTAVTRVYVPEKLHDKYVAMLAERAKKFVLGNQLSWATDMGPLVSAKQRERVEWYVKTGIEQGAKVVFGGKRPVGKDFDKGFFLQPTIISNTQQHMRICQEEIFGPVLTVFKYKTVEEAIGKSNDVVYGLASSVWGKDVTTLMKVAAKLKFGTVWINEHGALASEMPHGGYKQSGFGKDLSMYSLEEYTNLKHIYIDQTNVARKPWHYVVYGKKE